MSVLPEALLHLPDVGPERVKRLHSLGMRSWYDLMGSTAEHLPWGPDRHRRIVEEVQFYENSMVKFIAKGARF